MDPSRLSLEFLNELERAEAPLITWGVIDGSFTRDEVIARAQEFLERKQCSELSPKQLVERLQKHKLLFDLPGRIGRVWRTRMAETIRLTARLRQMFRLEHWRDGPTLVSDFRFALRPRTYPRRGIPVAAALKQWEAAGVVDRGYKASLVALLNRPGFTALAGFQVRATERVLRDLALTRDRAMIVTVGTGSGKTLAFYLPAMAYIAGVISKQAYWTKCIAIYPRNELLKDQFSEAYQEARRLDQQLTSQGKRKLLIGAFFGPTPNDVISADLKDKWQRVAGGYVCPYLQCPTPNCAGRLVWRDRDIAGGKERLTCSDCGHVASSDEVVLTRKRMQATPPDLLFTTTEMLNRSMTNAWQRHVFGIGAERPPRLVLLDEVHTYSGVHGAQVALLLRRWKHAIGREVQFTGLSATLQNASDFFAQLVGVRASAVQEITPSADELESEGMEYLIALRGDPVSQASLLSTTIQASMLLRRILDPIPSSALPEGPSEGLYGSKVFVFTDDLDVANRLYHNLLDAEGLNDRGIRNAGRLPLAALRARAHEPQTSRMLAGQSWYLAEEIGHAEGLRAPLKIGRTTSQDTGVEKDGDVIVATASLEVGYNDSSVGAVIQHKAPQDTASFLQRKGRAGRIRTMRPWTVIVLSDFGRDRLAYQAYEGLFDAAIPPRGLPVENRYVLRIQGTYAFMDWMAKQLTSAPKGSVYREFTGPLQGQARSRQDAEARIIRALLDGDSDREESLNLHLMRALRISREEVRALLWESPRALMVHVLPTLARRLETGWKRQSLGKEESSDEPRTENPLPDFLPSTLFADLSLPEVTILAPGRERPDTLPILQALRTLAVGKVTRRFAVTRSYVSHWVSPGDLSPDARNTTMPVEELCTEYEELGSYKCQIAEEVLSVRCIRPWLIVPTEVPKNVKVTSTAFLAWHSQLLPFGAPFILPLPDKLQWPTLIGALELYSHSHGAHIAARRFAFESNATIKRQRLPDQDVRIRFVTRDTKKVAAVGFQTHIDGLRLLVARPAHLLKSDSKSTTLLLGLRTAYFRHLVLNDPVLSEHTNRFQREWIHQVYFSALTATALKQESQLEFAHSTLQGEILARSAEKVLEVIFESGALELTDLAAEDLPNDDEEYQAPGSRGRLAQAIAESFADPIIAERLLKLAPYLWEEWSPEAEEWAWARYSSTIGSAVMVACTELYPEAVTGDLLLDVSPGYRPSEQVPTPSGFGELWITESTLGGGGILEEIARRYQDSPRRFYQLIESALGPSDHELVDSELYRILDRLPTDPTLREIFSAVRNAEGHEELGRAIRGLEDALADRGFVVSHTVMSALHARVLRPGSSEATDLFILRLIQQWRNEESRLGIEIDARVFSYIASDNSELNDALATLEGFTAGTRAFAFHAIYGLLWPRGSAVRAAGLIQYNPYTALPEPDRLLVVATLASGPPNVNLNSPQWKDEVAAGLQDTGVVTLSTGLDNYAILRSALLELASKPLDIGYLHLYPQVEALKRTVEGLKVTLGLAEAHQ